MKFKYDPESRYAVVGNVLMDLFFLNLLFMVSCLPIITIGAALISLSGATQEVLYTRTGSVYKTYFEKLRQEFWSGIGMLFTLLSISVILYISWSFSSLVGGWLFYPVRIGLIVGTIIVSIGAMFVFQYLARYEDTQLKALILSIRISMGNLRDCLMLLLVLIACLVLFISGPIGRALFLLIFSLLGFSGLSFVISYYFRRIFSKYEQDTQQVPVVPSTQVQ